MTFDEDPERGSPFANQGDFYWGAGWRVSLVPPPAIDDPTYDAKQATKAATQQRLRRAAHESEARRRKVCAHREDTLVESR